jgi:hypothetical protein
MFLLLPASVVMIMAADAPWKLKQIAQWNEEDARQVLADSPWAKTTRATIVRLETEDERRDGGKMGQDHGVGFDGVDGEKTRPRFAGIRSNDPDPRRTSQPLILNIRWESALPIRAAEMKARQIEPPILEGDGYSIAVYRVPDGYFKDDPKSLGKPLMKLAALKREGKRDVKPSSVEVFQGEDGLVVVYLFPLSAEITRKDGRIRFEAQIGRIVLAQYFDVEEMHFQGKLEL